MKIVDSFLFSQPHERDLLLAKLHAEYEHVDEFIGLESAYDFRGNYKGLHLDEVLRHIDFDFFKDKIMVISRETSLFPEGMEKKETNYFLSEFASRALCWDYVKSKYADNDWLIMSDVDEMLDFSSPARRDILLEGFKDSSPGIQWQNLKFWYDFDNLNFNPDKYIPCHKVGALKERENPFHHRNNHCKRLEPSLVCGLEYAYCFPRDDNWKKLNTFAHDRYTTQALDFGLHANHWHKEPQRGEFLNHPTDFFETINLDESCSTTFVLDNLDQLKVNTVNPDYAEARQSMYNMEMPHPVLQHNLTRGYKINKKYFYLTR